MASSPLTQARGQVRPQTNTNTSGGADSQANIGSSVNNPSIVLAPSSQRNPVHAPPDEKLARPERAGTQQEADALRRSEDPNLRYEAETRPFEQPSPLPTPQATDTPVPGSEQWRRERAGD